MLTFIRKNFINLFFRLFYLFGTPPWDSGVSPPELIEFIASHPPGRAIDLGCGTGTNVLTLAEHNWQASGIDFVPKAIRQARRKALQNDLPAKFSVGDVTDPGLFQGTYDLILDMGCYHVLSSSQRAAYRANIEKALAPGGTFMLYAFLNPDPDEDTAIDEQDIRAFEKHLTLTKRQDSSDAGGGGGRLSTWLWFQRKTVP